MALSFCSERQETLVKHENGFVCVPTSVGWSNLHPADVPCVAGKEEQGCRSLGQVDGFTFRNARAKDTNKQCRIWASFCSCQGLALGGFWQHPQLGWVLSSHKV